MADVPRKRRLFDPRYVSTERRRAYVLACILFWSVLMFLFLNRCLFSAVEVVGPSMEPTFQNGDRHFLRRWPYYFREPQRGDIVAVTHPSDPDLSVKRIVAIPGDTLQIRDRGVYVNTLRLEELYLGDKVDTYPHHFGQEPILISDDHYFVMGDNRGNSEDSRAYGPVSRDALKGTISQ